MPLTSDKTVTRSFRISEAALGAMQDEAARKNVSVNTLLNQLIVSYTKYDRFLKRFQLMKLTGVSFRRILDATSSRTISKAGHLAGGAVPSGLITARAGHVTLDTVIEYLKDTGDYNDLFEFSEVPHGGRRVITLSHQLGMKGSLYFSKYVEAIMTSIGVQPRVTYTSDSVMVEV